MNKAYADRALLIFLLQIGITKASSYCLDYFLRLLLS